MKPEQQRIAIAEKCGWTLTESKVFGIDPKTHGLDSIPHYLEDLNAMHEAEKVLLSGMKCTDDVVAGTLSGDYFMRLSDVTERDDHMMFTATAAQRAEAFCRVFWPERFKD